MSGTEDLLVEPDRLAAELDRADPPTLLDVRWRLAGPPGREDYLAGHLPGAVFVDLDTELCGRPGAAGRHPLPDPAALQAALRAAGVRAGHPVVVYDGGDGMSAARAWWTLRWAGHRAVRVLHGGFPAWVAAGLPLSTEAPAPTPGDVTVAPGELPVLDAGEAARLAAADTGVLLDVRAAPRYRGETEPIDPVAGHIPGAVNAPFAELAPGGRFLEPGELRERLGGEPFVAYCGSGVSACNLLVAAELAGVEARLYPGSWSEWIAADRPIATGD
jgi:thiosulfate/3-mercaptopyruvate sulfurtransferase